ncbi:MAG TPA: hydrogenase 4 subunit B [Bryobacteraceae bacterium]|nr:hydrogenase 4 subunit B [Bryobacteraceae bacterium]
MPAAELLFNAALIAYVLGAAAGLFLAAGPARARFAAFLLALAGASLELVSSALACIQGLNLSWSLPCGVPLFSWTVRLDPLSSFFSLALALLGVAVSIFSFGYLRDWQGRKNIGILGFFYNLLLLSLALVFTASNAFFFLLAWEVMALAAYCLVSFEHEKEETRKAGILFLIMSHTGTGLLLIAFLTLASIAHGLDFTSFHGLASTLPAWQSGAVFVLFFLGFGVKAGVIPIHVWLPAAHPVAPSNISALMSGIVIKAGIYGLARVCFDFFDVAPLWAGILVLSIGVLSALLGVLYALMEHDLKRLLAYHSIENIGIILIGFGASMMFHSLGHSNLAALALIAGLYHTLNHAIFKCLLFLAAGSVLHSTRTRNMDRMGGLIRSMPVTSLFFLIGAVAISGLPPLNGFVSEWLTYQALLAGFGTTHSLTRVLFPLAGALLALTAALAAACFVKAFGITFLALPRSEEAETAHEAPFSMQLGMAILAAACVALGLGATWFLPIFDPLTQQALGLRISSELLAANSFALTAGSPHSGTVSTAGIAASLVLISLVPALLQLAWARRARQSTGPVWDCGLPALTAENEYTATAFSKPLRMIFSALYRPRREIQAEYDVSPYYPTAIRFESEIEPAFEKHLYDPLKRRVLALAGRMRAIQAGSIHAYLAYIFITLILLLLFGVRG